MSFFNDITGLLAKKVTTQGTTTGASNTGSLGNVSTAVNDMFGGSTTTGGISGNIGFGYGKTTTTGTDAMPNTGKQAVSGLIAIALPLVIVVGIVAGIVWIVKKAF